METNTLVSTQSARAHLIEVAGGDARNVLNALELPLNHRAE